MADSHLLSVAHDKRDKEEPQFEGPKREIGGRAVWSTSSSKPGCGAEQLRDGSTDTFWQSDGHGPHLINIHFPTRVVVDAVCMFLNYNLDESYTPCSILIRAGTSSNDLFDVGTWELDEPIGWEQFPLPKDDKSLFVNFIQVNIVSNHQNGRDTHVRQMRVYGPRQSLMHIVHGKEFVAPELTLHAFVR